MVQIIPKPILLKDVTATIGADTYERGLSSVALTPNVSPSKWRGMSPGAVYSDAPQADWDAALTLAQDHETAGALSDYLFANEGQKVTMTLKPAASFGASYQVTVYVLPGAIGGAVGAWAEASVVLPCDGRPVKIPAGSALPVPGLAVPVSGPIAGGTMVVVTGSNFAGATAVHFGTTVVPVADWTLVSPSLIVAKAPAQAAGSKPVKVTNASGQSSAAAAYSYV